MKTSAYFLTAALASFLLTACQPQDEMTPQAPLATPSSARVNASVPAIAATYHSASLLFGTYDKGVQAFVAIDGSDMIEVHRSQNSNQGIWLDNGWLGSDGTWHVKNEQLSVHTASLSPKDQVFPTAGNDPAVAFRRGGSKQFVIVFSATSYSDKLAFFSGTTSKGALSTKAFGLLESSGKNPYVAVRADGQLCVVFEKDGLVYYQTGTLTSGGDYSFNKPSAYARGGNPAWAYNDKGQFIEAHEDNGNIVLGSSVFGGYTVGIGTRPSLFLDDSNVFSLVYSRGSKIYQVTGWMDTSAGKLVITGAERYIGDGDTGSIARAIDNGNGHGWLGVHISKGSTLMNALTVF